MIFNIILYYLWTYFDFFEKVFMPNNFYYQEEKYVLMGGRPMPECSMVNWLSDIVGKSFGSYQTVRCFLDAFNLLTVLLKLDTA